MKQPPPYAPVQANMGNVSYDLSRSPGAFGRNITPNIWRRYTNLGYTDIQLHNGMQGQRLTGRQFPYFNDIFVINFTPRIPGQQRGDVAGFHKRGPSPYNIQDWMNAGPGSQPEHPGGPGQIVGSNQIYNPMSG
jgi:hypothetical protein